MSKSKDTIELNDTERNQIAMCIVTTIKTCKPEETIDVMRALTPILDKLERKDARHPVT